MKLPRIHIRLDALLITLVIAGSLAGLFWNARAKQNAPVVFWEGLQNSMTTPSVTCTIAKLSDTAAQNQDITIDLMAKRAQSTTTIEQAKSTVTTEEIATPSDEYVRYTQIQTQQKNAAGKPIDFSKALNVWGKHSGGTTLYTQTILGGCVVPIAKLSDVQASDLMKTLKAGKVFQTDFSKSKLTAYEGRTVRTYQVQVPPGPYITFMKQLAKQLGLHDLDTVNEASYAQAKPAGMTMTIDANSHQLLKLDYSTGKHTDTFTGYGKPVSIQLPRATLNSTELQQRLQSAQ